ncbi:MAG TPA: hypothetical protein VNO30_02925 [Kofleriaceae bacterium]|nr:hypothetical protein [Kofleriaceae bacterium]
MRAATHSFFAACLAACLAALAALAAVAGRAAATPYEAFIEVEDQADLEDLLAAGDLTQDTYTELLALLEVGVDLSRADRAQLYSLPNLTYDDVDRILAYRDQHGGRIRDPAALVAAGALTQAQLRALRPFLVGRDPDEHGVTGWVRGAARLAIRDQLLPPLLLRGRLATSDDVTFGFAGVFTRLAISPPIFEPNRGALIADRPTYGAALPKLYLRYEDADTAAIAGSFRAGFGQRLVFDNTQHGAPNGLYSDDELVYAPDLEPACREAAGELAASPCDGAAGGRHVTPDFRYREALFGAAGGWKRRPLGAGWIQAYAWASSARRSVHQDELVDRGRCPDPHADGDPACDPPPVFVRPDGPILTPTSRFASQVLPDMFAEWLAGVHLTYFADRRNAIGLTAYGALLAGQVDNLELDTQEHSRLPTGRRYGAAGASFAFGAGALDLAGEAALSVDRLPDGTGPQEGGGGPAAIVRATVTGAAQELEATLRYYSIDHANPYARPISQPDELEGQRARDEVGARLRYARTGARLTLRALADVWAPLSSLGTDSPLGRAQPKLDSYLRADARAAGALRLGLWLRYQDGDLRASGPAPCFAAPAADAGGAPIACSGRQLTTIARAHAAVSRALAVTALGEHHFVDDGLDPMSPFAGKLRQDVAGWLIALWRPDPGLRVRGRVRYLHQAVNSDRDDYLERSLAALLDVSLGIGGDVLRARADVKLWRDRRAATLERTPNPELQLWLSYEARL